MQTSSAEKGKAGQEPSAYRVRVVPLLLLLIILLLLLLLILPFLLKFILFLSYSCIHLNPQNPFWFPKKVVP